MYQHKHAYVFEYLLKRKAPDRGYERCLYTLLTDIDSQHNPENRKLLEQGFCVGFGFMPRIVQYQYDEYEIK